MNRPDPNPNPGCLFHPLLTESIHRFLTEYHRGCTDFSNFSSIFSRLLHNSPGPPPLDLLWFHSALTFHSTNAPLPNPPKQSLLLTKDLFHLLVSGSHPCSPVAKIAALAPVVCRLYYHGLENEELRMEVESLLEGILGYISICCSWENEESGVLGSCFGDLVRVWVVDRAGEGCGVEEVLKVFFPLVSDGVRKRVVCEECGLGYLAGVVMCEVFLWSLCLKAGGRCRVSKVDLGEELRDWGVRTVAAFRSYYFFDILLGTLLEPVFSFNSLLNSEDMCFLRNVLYDVMLVECPLLSPVKGIQLSDGLRKNLAVAWLCVVHNALEFIWESGDQTKAISYLQAFSESYIPTQLIKLVMNHPAMKSQTSLPCISTPLALIKASVVSLVKRSIKLLDQLSFWIHYGNAFYADSCLTVIANWINMEWLVHAEDQGAIVFDGSISKNHARTISHQSRIEHELLKVLPDKKLGGRFCTGHNGKEQDKPCNDLELSNCLDSAFFVDPGLMKLGAINGTRKRKDGIVDEWDNKQVKFVRCHLIEDSVRQMELPSVDDDGLSCGGKVGNPICDEEVTYMEV